jgi:hypothetical protein
LFYSCASCTFRKRCSPIDFSSCFSSFFSNIFPSFCFLLHFRSFYSPVHTHHAKYFLLLSILYFLSLLHSHSASIHTPYYIPTNYCYFVVCYSSIFTFSLTTPNTSCPIVPPVICTSCSVAFPFSHHILSYIPTTYCYFVVCCIYISETTPSKHTTCYIPCSIYNCCITFNITSMISIVPCSENVTCNTSILFYCYSIIILGLVKWVCTINFTTIACYICSYNNTYSYILINLSMNNTTT